uniref:C-type lectin domain-containing protein n=1 Tax=Panagrolaimus davidi TaxID=227884 RepID=A0A914QGJ1_9BILA
MHFKILFIFWCIAPFVLSLCPSESWSWQSYCLFFNSTPTNFGNSELSCQKVHGRLTSIHDAFYNAVLSQTAAKEFLNTNATDFWIGATKYTWDESWIWDDGTSLNYTDWKNGEPNNGTGKDCAASSLTDGYWSAQKCSELKPFVCELPERLFTSTTEAPTTKSYPISFNCTDGGVYYSPTGSCYFALEKSQTWKNAGIQCKSFGSDLTSIHTDSELNFLFFKYIKPLKQSFWIGLHSDDEEKTWKWTDNSLFDYSPWLTGYPQTIKGSDCGFIIIQQEDVHYDAYFANDQCNNTYFSICKKFYLN